MNETKYNILIYDHKKIIIKDLKNFSDDDFKKQIVLNSKKLFFSQYDLKLFFIHIRNINLCLNKLSKKYKSTTETSLKNSIIFLYENYLESFVDSVINHYFYVTSKDDIKQEILNKITQLIWNETKFQKL